MFKYVLVALVLISPMTLANPNFNCDNGTVSETGWRFVQCLAHHPSPLVPSRAGWDYPAGWVLPDTPDQPLQVIMRFDGYSAGLGTILPESPRPDAVMVQTIYGDYPGEPYWTAPDGRQPWDIGGIFLGENTNGERYAATLDAIANSPYRYNIDWGKGLQFQGHCYGGLASYNQALLIPPRWQSQLAIVHAGTTGLMTVNEGSMMSEEPYIQYAWEGFDLDKADYTKNLDKLKNVYFRVTGSHPYTDNVRYLLSFFSEVCDAGKIACYGQWHDSGHMDNDLKAPESYDQSYQDLYTDRMMDWRLDSMKIIFTHATSNYLSNAEGHLRGHWNMGLGFNALIKSLPAGCEEFNIPIWTDTTTKIIVPIRYIRRTGMGPGLPDQPLTSTFDLTIRPKMFVLHTGDLVSWQVGTQTGQSVADEGEITIEKITLKTGPAFVALVLTK